MSTYFSAPYLFAIGFYASIIALVLLVVFSLFGRTRGSRWSAVGLILSVCIVAMSVLFGDWKIPNCYDAEGNLMSELPQCRFSP